MRGVLACVHTRYCYPAVPDPSFTESEFESIAMINQSINPGIINYYIDAILVRFIGQRRRQQPCMYDPGHQ